MYEGNHYFHLRKPNKPQMRLVTNSPDKDLYLNNFVWVSGQWEFQADDPGHFSISRQKGYIPVGKRKYIFVSLYLGLSCVILCLFCLVAI